MKKESASDIWGGRFSSAPDEFVKYYTASIPFDYRLFEVDIDCTEAHVKMLGHVNVLTEKEVSTILEGLKKIRIMANDQALEWSIDKEDIHMNIESELINLIGDVAKKVHTGRSRNDQVATDMRLFLRREIDHLLQGIERLQLAIISVSELEVDTIMPGCTHLQPAQPILLAHHLMAWFDMLSRDKDRLIDCRKRVNCLPLGSAALAGTTFPIDRHYVANALGFEVVMSNSIDAVSDRDFIIEFISAISIMMMHFSRWAEEMIIWSTVQYNFIDLPDKLCTGSSIMPQKKNPDLPELIRGKSGRVFGHLMNLLTLMKGQALAYNKDNQEDKEPLFDTLETANNTIQALQLIFEEVSFNRERMYEVASEGYTTATDLADYLVRNEIPFRDAHEITGKLVKIAIESDCLLSELSLEQMQAVSSVIKEDIFNYLTLEGSISARNHWGGTARDSVMEQLSIAKALIEGSRG